LEVEEEDIKLGLQATAIVELATGVQDGAHQASAEEVTRRVNGGWSFWVRLHVF